MSKSFVQRRLVETSLFSIVLLSTGWPADAKADAPTKEETLNAIEEIIKLFPRCEADETQIRDVTLQYGAQAVFPNGIRFLIRNRNTKFDGEREFEVNLSDSKRIPIVEEVGNGSAYKVTFSCNYTACISPGQHTIGSMVLCADLPPNEPRKTLNRLLKAIDHLWELAPRQKEPPF